MALKRSTLPKPIRYRFGDASCNMPGGRSRKNRCVLCGRTGAETLLNKEQAIHHHGKIECLDRKSCNRKRRKRRKNNRGNKNVDR